MPHKRFNKVYDRTRYHNDMQFGDGSDWATFPAMKLTKFGWGCDYDGSAMYGNCDNDASLNITGAIAIELRTKIKDLSSVQYLSDKGEGNVSGYYWRITIDGKVNYVTNQTGANQQTLSSADAVIVGLWYYLTLTRNKTKAKSHVNGKDTTTTIGSHVDPLSSPEPFLIGVEDLTGSYFNIAVDGIMVYNWTLSAAKQKDNYWRYN